MKQIIKLLLLNRERKDRNEPCWLSIAQWHWVIVDGHRRVFYQIRGKNYVIDVLLKESHEGSGLSASESSQGSHPFYSLFIKFSNYHSYECK